MVSTRGGCMKDERELSILVGLHSLLTSWLSLWLNLLVSWKGHLLCSTSSPPSSWQGDKKLCNPWQPLIWLCLHSRTEERLGPHKFMQTLSLYSRPRVQSLNVFFFFQSWKLHFRIDDDFSCCFSISFLFLFSALLSALSSEGSGYVLPSFNSGLFLALN